MPHKVVISLTQIFALMMSAFLLWGIITVNNLNSCIAGDTYFCIVDSLLLALMGITAFLLVGFTFVLFRAYSD